jgi:hypothetical protein
MHQLFWYGVIVEVLAGGLALAQPPLPPLRPVAESPAVAMTGVEVRPDGSTAAVPATPVFALSDLAIIDENVSTVFSLSGPAVYPAESLAANRATRARAWLERVPASGHGVLMDLVFRAELQAAAGDDAGAERTYAAALASASPGRRSYVLESAVTAFVAGERDDSALGRRLVIAERHVAEVMALPKGGYASAYDSSLLVHRVYGSAVTVLAASARLGDTARVRVHLGHALTVLRQFTGVERAGFFRADFPYEMVATVMLGQPHARAALDSLTGRVLRIVALTPSELLALAPDERARVSEGVRNEVLARIARAAPLGRRAPPILAHAWINTPDSLYQPVPRAHPFDDGVIRVLYFPRDWWRDGAYWAFPVLTRLHDAIAPWGQVVIVTHANGNVGTDLAEAPDEVAWLRGLYGGMAHVTPVVAQWAAPKEPAPFDGRLPVRPLRDPVYEDPHYPVLVIDGHGIVRGLAGVESRRDEDALRLALVYLHDEAAGTATARRPAMLVPADARVH